MRQILLVLSFFCILAYGFWIFPTWNKIEEVEGKLNKLNTSISDKEIQLAGLQKQQEDLKSGGGEGPTSADLLMKIPEGHRQDLLIKTLEDLATANQYRFEALSFARGMNADLNVPQMTVSFSVTGPNDPRQFAKYLAAIESDDRFLMMDNLNFTTQDTDGRNELTTSITLRALSQPVKKSDSEITS